MQLTFLVLGLAVTFSISLSAQDTVYVKRELNQSEVDLVFSYYSQDGNRSAVTGGTGTEKLKVYSSKLVTRNPINDHDHLLLDVGIDVISSASTDNIDFIRSSASRTDGHETVAAGYARSSRKKLEEWGFKLNASLESDYFSKGVNVWYDKKIPASLTSVGVKLDIYFDDLRWGWLDDGFLKPQFLIYPAELRDTNWFDFTHRNSYNLGLSLVREISPRSSFGIFPALLHQTGLLSTPFHRVYFAGMSRPRVERLPQSRTGGALGLQYNVRTHSQFIMRSYYQFYTDDFGTSAHTFRIETPFLLSAKSVVTPSVRLYSQRKSRFFAPRDRNDPEAAFYTSDYDLSAFWSATAGLAWRISTLAGGESKWTGRSIDFKYDFYWRSDGLRAHILTSLFSWISPRKR